MTNGRPPALTTASTTAAPRPLDPPVTITASMCLSCSAGGGLGRGDGPGGGTAVQVGHEDGLAAPALDELRLGDGVVVTALDPDVGAQPGQRRLRGGLVEDDHGVDAVEGGQQASPVVLRVQR